MRYLSNYLERSLGNISRVKLWWFHFSFWVFSLGIKSQVQFSTININAKNGLPTNAVNYVFKDSYGFYWIGTQLGLCKFDGYKVERVFNSKYDSLSLNCNNVFCISQYKNYLILTCENGIKFYDIIKQKIFVPKRLMDATEGVYIYECLVRGKSIFVVSSKGLIEYHFEQDNIFWYKIMNDENEDYEMSGDTRFFIDKNYFLLIDVNYGIRRIDTIRKIITSEKIIENVSYRPVDVVHYGNNLYVLYSKLGLIRVDAKTLEKIDEPINPKVLKLETNDDFKSLVIIKNKIYIATKNYIYEYNPLFSTIQQLTYKDRSEKEQIRRMFNYDDNLFIVTYFNGFYILPFSLQKVFYSVPPRINSLFSNTFAIYEYLPGKILVGGEGKLYLYNYKTQKIEADFQDLFKNIMIISICATRDPGQFFIGTYGNGLILFDILKKKIQTIKNDKNPEARDYLSLYLDKNDTLWCGSVGEGMFKYHMKSKKWIKVEFFQNFTINFITRKNNYYWVGTIENGAFQLDSNMNVIEHFNTNNKSLPHNCVYCIDEDSNYVYFATDNGLAMYDKKNKLSKFYNESDGLSASTVLSVMKDKNENLWVSTVKGIAKIVVPNAFKPNMNVLYNYTTLDGLVNYEFDQNAYCMLLNGYLVYGGTSGLDFINPTKFRSSFKNIPIFVTSFRKNGKEYFFDTATFLKRFFIVDWRQNNIQLEVTAISPLSSEKVLYKYKLSGYDDEYSEPTDIRYISYTGLPGGTYKLLILATNQDGEWNTEPYYIYVKVIPPFWKTPWFVITASVIILGGIIGTNQYRTYQIKKRNKELEQKVQERTKELADKNHEILSSIEYAKRIQQAILPDDKYIQKVLPNAFILYKPKDIVSGDFYWVYEVTPKDSSQNRSIIIAAVDCTGHGVPGSLMSMIGNNLLNQIVIEKNITSPDKILYEMNKGVQMALKQGQSEIQTNDGMDASIVQIFQDGTLYWAGAYRPIVIVRINGTVEKIEGDKYPLGGVQMDSNRQFTLHSFKLQKGDVFYIFSDGYADQFGGDKGRKMMMKRFISILSEIHLKPIEEQKSILETYFENWKGQYDQIDDVLVIGVVYS
ncbi:MAG: hypothetical protein KatS3mg027_1501 [Bacteroidia bacterium]|nr:MAG: hypothetical protein KatS3mg027_1501 [Bacteroidia bacterium]